MNNRNVATYMAASALVVAVASTAVLVVLVVDSDPEEPIRGTLQAEQSGESYDWSTVIFEIQEPTIVCRELSLAEEMYEQILTSPNDDVLVEVFPEIHFTRFLGTGECKMVVNGGQWKFHEPSGYVQVRLGGDAGIWWAPLQYLTAVSEVFGEDDE